MRKRLPSWGSLEPKPVRVGYERALAEQLRYKIKSPAADQADIVILLSVLLEKLCINSASESSFPRSSS